VIEVGKQSGRAASQKNLSDDVSLICTIYNEAEGLPGFLDSIFAMSALPAEIIIVDGGSMDSTVEIIGSYVEKWSKVVPIRLIVDKTCNLKYHPGPIAKGRNIAIQNSSYEIIACTDAGCILDHFWLERLTAPMLLNPSVDVVGGWFRTDAKTYFQKCLEMFWIVPGKNVSVDNFLPSSRSFAFRKKVWRQVGGYPEIFYTGEDTAFVLKIRSSGYKIFCEPNALVSWPMKTDLASYARLVYRYGQGDGYASLLPINVVRNSLKLIIAAALIVLGIVISPWFYPLLIIYWSYLVLSRRLNDLHPNIMVYLPLSILLKIVFDISYIAGYFKGKMIKRNNS
jgi:cellulose synthase/poly-beta-1,6-N-acetylglucosamine synthase-like glycosyltransferase